MARSVCERILERAKQFDDSAQIASVSRRDADDGILVRLATSAGSSGLVKALREACPLASVCLVENRVCGRTEAQVLLPSETEQRQIAKGLAEHSAWQASLRWVANALMVLLSIACVQKVVEISRD